MPFAILKAGSAAARRRLQAVRDRLYVLERAGSAASRRKTRAVFGRALTPVEVVNAIVEGVRRRGDRAAFEFARRLDVFAVTADTVRVPAAELRRAHRTCDRRLLAAVRAAARNIRRYQKRLLPGRAALKTTQGIATGARYVPLERVGVYVPGVPAAFPSSVLMNALPALVAGVREVAVCTPPDRSGLVAQGVLAAAHEIGLREVYRLGGAQAVAAMAFGTESIPRVDKVVGPGNLFVMLAKRAVYGACDVDGFYGPSEVLIIADGSARADCIAADLLAQAEHDGLASSVLVTPSAALARAVKKETADRLRALPRGEPARESLANYGFALLVKSMAEAVKFANEFAPEHLQVITGNPRRLLAGIRNAGAVFLGQSTPEVVGDYIAGPSHTLPTGGTARFMSGLAAPMFLRRMSVISASAGALKTCLPHLAALARAEGLEAHARSAEVRFES